MYTMADMYNISIFLFFPCPPIPITNPLLVKNNQLMYAKETDHIFYTVYVQI